MQYQTPSQYLRVVISTTHALTSKEQQHNNKRQHVYNSLISITATQLLIVISVAVSLQVCNKLHYYKNITSVERFVT